MCVHIISTLGTNSLLALNDIEMVGRIITNVTRGNKEAHLDFLEY